MLARKARFQQQHNEREQRRRGELLAGQVQRAAEHRLLDEQRKEDKAARRAARYVHIYYTRAVCVCVCASRRTRAHPTLCLPRQTLRKQTLTRAAELAETNAQKWNKDNLRVADLHAQQNALEEERRRAAAASRHHDFISGGGGRVPPGLSRNGLAKAPSGASSGFGSSSQLRDRSFSIEALMAEEPTANERVLEENQARRPLLPTLRRPTPTHDYHLPYDYLLRQPTFTPVHKLPYYNLPLSTSLLRTRRS